MSYDGNDDGIRNGHYAAPGNRLSGVEIAPVTRRSGAVPQIIAPAPVPPRRWRRFASYAVAGGIAASALGAGVRPWLQPRTVVAATSLSDVAAPRQVTTTQPEQQTIGEVTLPATVEAFQSARLFSRVSGYVKAWHAEIGQDVKAGDLLVEIDTPELDQELMQARADLGISQAAVTQAEAELTESIAALDQAKADRVRSQADVELANSRLKRREVLLGKQAATQEEFDTAVRDRDARKAEVTASDATITRQVAAVGTRRAVIESRKAAVESAEANVRRLEELQSFQKVVAPFNGVVTQRTAEVGNLVTAGNSAANEALYQLAQTDRVRVQVAVPQSEAAGVTVGSEVVVRVPEHPDHTVSAVVTRTSRSVDPTTRTLLAEIELPNSAELFPPGIYAEVAIATRSPESTWLVPTNTVRMQVDGPHVVFATDRGQLQVRPVRLGRDFGRSVAVLEGVTGSERLVVNPTDDLRDGMSVSVEQPKTPPAVAAR
jgi:RND family efflux transporter MFP subunit